jgi:hypothetical protein
VNRLQKSSVQVATHDLKPPCYTEVGKTCLIWRFAADQFSTRTMNTIGIDFKIKYVKIDNVRVKLQVLSCQPVRPMQ